MKYGFWVSGVWVSGFGLAEDLSLRYHFLKYTNFGNNFPFKHFEEFMKIFFSVSPSIQALSLSPTETPIESMA